MSRLHAFDAWFLLLLLAFGAVSLYLAGTFGIWFDEAYSVALSHQPLDKVLYFAAQDVHPPGYYLLLKGWETLFGDSEIALRSLSALSMVLAAGLIYRVFRSRIGARAALLIAASVMSAPLTLRYAFEARMYGLIMLVATLATITMLRLFERRPGDNRRLLMAAYGVLVAAGMYIHYYALFIWIAHGLFVLLAGKEDRLDRLKAWSTGIILAILLFLPQLPTAYAQFAAAGERTPSSGGFSPYNVLTSLFNAISFADTSRQLWLYVVAGAALSLAAVAVVLAYRLAGKRLRGYFTLLMLLFAVPLLLGLGLTLSPYRVTYYDRYFIFSLTALVTLAALAGTVLWQNRTYRLFAAVMLASLLLGNGIGVTQVIAYGNYNNNQTLRTGIKELITALGDRAAKGDVILLDHPRHYYEVDYYNRKHLPLYIYDKPGDTERTGGIAIAASRKELFRTDVDTIMTNGGRVWYITPRALSVTPIPASWRQIDEVAQDSYIARLYTK